MAKIFCGFYGAVATPLFTAKNKMTSFERYFIDDESTWVEIKDEYYHLIEKTERMQQNFMRVRN